MLKPKGIIIFDDYLWKSHYEKINQLPGFGINSLITAKTAQDDLVSCYNAMEMHAV